VALKSRGYITTYQDPNQPPHRLKTEKQKMIKTWTQIKQMPNGAPKKFYLIKQFGRVISFGLQGTGRLPAELSCTEMVTLIKAQLGNAISDK
jgi:hypothetical protein